MALWKRYAQVAALSLVTLFVGSGCEKSAPPAATASPSAAPAASSTPAPKRLTEPSIKPFELALGEKVGNATFHISEDVDDPGQPSQSGSLRAPKEHEKAFPQVAFTKEIEVDVTTIDVWAKEHGVERVHLLGLDIQGVEL